MKTYYYYKVIRKTIIQFCDQFNEIYVGRYNSNGVLLKTVLVPVRFGPKAKQYLWYKEHGRNEEMLPIISVDIQAIDFDPNRLGNSTQEVIVSKDMTNLLGSYYRVPAPYNITFNVRVWALHMVDIDQIFEQILPYFAPYTFMRINIPEVDTTIEIKVILSSCSPEMTDDVGEEEARVLRWSILFTVQAWLFKPISAAGASKALVEKIFLNQYVDPAAWASRDTTSMYTSAAQYPGQNWGESIFMEGLGYDDDARLLYNYEIFSGNVSPSWSPSKSPSLSPSESPSLSPSKSPSVSASISSSLSPSESPSASLSPSLSPSTSPSVSPSTSV